MKFHDIAEIKDSSHHRYISRSDLQFYLEKKLEEAMDALTQAGTVQDRAVGGMTVLREILGEMRQ